MKLELELKMRDGSIAAVNAEHDPVYDAFLQYKVDRARAQIAGGRHVSNETVEAEFSERRDAVRRKTDWR